MIENKLKDLKEYFRSINTKYIFISPTNFNLCDMHNWVKSWTNINFIDCYDSNASSCVLPGREPDRALRSIEEINEFLIDDQKIKTIFENNEGGSAIFLFFNKKIEKKLVTLNQTIILPKNSLVKKIDNKIITTEIGDSVNVESVPNYLGKVADYENLIEIAEKNKLGNELVVQTPYGDSGKTTFFISSKKDYQSSSAQIEEEDSVKVMKRINCVGGAIEACATSVGTFVGPLLGELVGFDSLTPYEGGWCGNELYDEQFSKKVRSSVHLKTQKLGNALYKMGYKGYFEVDYLIDLETEDVYLGEINPRITGITSMTSMSHFCQQSVPLFLFHLLEYSNEAIKINVDEYNEYSLKCGGEGISSQIILKDCNTNIRKVVSAPSSGIYEIRDGKLEFVNHSSNPSDKGSDPNRLYLLRILRVDDYTYRGADQCILFLNQKLTSSKGKKLNDFVTKLILSSRNLFEIRDLTSEEKKLISRFSSPSMNKEV